MPEILVKVKVPSSDYCKHANGEICKFTKGITQLRCVLFNTELGMVQKGNKFYINKCRECLLHDVL